MQILSHRGLWKQRSESNRKGAFARSFSEGFGTETDIRWQDGQLVIAHDIDELAAMPLAEFLDLYGESGGELPLALNIKADGLQAPLKHALSVAGVSNYFVFDMSVPDMLGYLRTGMQCYTRASDLEPEPVALERCSGVWVDALESDWITPTELARMRSWGKPLCFVSPELHGRDHLQVWALLRANSQGEDGMALCTDFPLEAREFFA